MRPPSPEAAALLANHGIVPGSLIAAPAADATTTVSTTPVVPATDPIVPATDAVVPVADPAVPVP